MGICLKNRNICHGNGNFYLLNTLSLTPRFLTSLSHCTFSNCLTWIPCQHSQTAVSFPITSAFSPTLFYYSLYFPANINFSLTQTPISSSPVPRTPRTFPTNTLKPPKHNHLPKPLLNCPKISNSLRQPLLSPTISSHQPQPPTQHAIISALLKTMAEHFMFSIRPKYPLKALYPLSLFPNIVHRNQPVFPPWNTFPRLWPEIPGHPVPTSPPFMLFCVLAAPQTKVSQPVAWRGGITPRGTVGCSSSTQDSESQGLIKIITHLRVYYGWYC